MAKKTFKMIKTVYFDEQSARDYIDVVNGGRFDWSTAEDKERIAKIIAEIDAEMGSGFNLFSWLKASVSGKMSGEYDREAKRAIETKLTNTLLTDYITIAHKDKNISHFTDVVYAPPNSISLYKMYSPYILFSIVLSTSFLTKEFMRIRTIDWNYLSRLLFVRQTTNPRMILNPIWGRPFIHALML